MPAHGRAKGKGNYYNPWPVDFVLLEMLPDDGLIAGVHWAGRQVRHLTDELNDRLKGVEGVESFRNSQVMARMRSMHVVGYVTNHGSTSGDVWARTKEGAEFLRRKNEILGLPEGEEEEGKA